MSKKDGTIIQSTGLQHESSEQSESQDPDPSANGEQRMASVEDDEYGSSRTNAELSAGEVAKLVFRFVTAASSFSHGMKEGDDVQMLTLRTKKSEFIIIPGTIPRAIYNVSTMLIAMARCQVPPCSSSECSAARYLSPRLKSGNTHSAA